MSAVKERSFGLLIYGGGVAFVVGLVAGCILSLGTTMQGVRFESDGGGLGRLAIACIFVSALGFLAMVGGLVAGVTGAARSFRGTPVVYPKARVVARYALDANLVMHTTEDAVAFADRPKFYVRLDVGAGDNEEYQCAEPVFWAAGEGMWGEVCLQGKWLSSFAPLRMPSSHRANDTFGL